MVSETMTTTQSAAPLHAYPRGLHGCYRGRLVRDPRVIDRAGKSPMATGRIAVPMAAGNKSKEDRDALTEWVNVIAFDERCRHLLMSCSKGQLIAVMGGVTLDFYQGKNDRTRKISRTLIIEDLYASAASIQPKTSHPADIDHTLKNRIGSVTDTLDGRTERNDDRMDRNPEEVELPEDELPTLD